VADVTSSKWSCATPAASRSGGQIRSIHRCRPAATSRVLPSTLTAVGDPDDLRPEARLDDNSVVVEPTVFNPGDRINVGILVSGYSASAGAVDVDVRVAGVASASFGLLDIATAFSATVAVLDLSALIATRRAIPASSEETPRTAPST
jgi:hypothetical protein